MLLNVLSITNEKKQIGQSNKNFQRIFIHVHSLLTIHYSLITHLIFLPYPIHSITHHCHYAERFWLVSNNHRWDNAAKPVKELGKIRSCYKARFVDRSISFLRVHRAPASPRRFEGQYLLM